jgi:hypothetical protein
MKKPFLVALLLSLPLSVFAQVDKEEAVKAECSVILSKPFDGGLDPSVQPDCDSVAYYFGIGRDKDYASARSCAFIERFKHVDKDGSLFTGAGILSMVFANGEGTPRDLDLARRFTCENKEAAPLEIDNRLRLIDKIATAPAQARRFDLCTSSNTGQSAAWCESVQLRINDTRRYNDLIKIVDGLTPQGQEAFKVLQSAEQTFEALRSEKEVDQTGTARGALSLQEQNRIRTQFVADFKLFASPDFSQPASLAVVDAKVNAEYANVHANAPRIFRNTTLTFEGVQETQASWLKYRDAWRAYEAVVSPAVSGDAVATQISRERLYHLHKLATTF